MVALPRTTKQQEEEEDQEEEDEEEEEEQSEEYRVTTSSRSYTELSRRCRLSASHRALFNPRFHLTWALTVTYRTPPHTGKQYM